MDPRGTVGRIYDHYTLLHTKYESFGSCGFREEDFLRFSRRPGGGGGGGGGGIPYGWVPYGHQGHSWQDS